MSYSRDEMKISERDCGGWRRLNDETEKSRKKRRYRKRRTNSLTRRSESCTKMITTTIGHHHHIHRHQNLPEPSVISPKPENINPPWHISHQNLRKRRERPLWVIISKSMLSVKIMCNLTWSCVRCVAENSLTTDWQNT